MNEINSICQRNMLQFFIEDINPNWTAVKSSYGGETFNRAIDLTQNFEYVVPISAVSTPTAVSIPFLYISLISAYLYISDVVGDNFSDVLEKINGVFATTIAIAFYDIGGSKHSVKFQVKFDLAVFRRGKEKPPKFTGALIFSRRSF
jgi:hypothetical protein